MRKSFTLILIFFLLTSCKSGEKISSPDHYILKQSVTGKVKSGTPAEFRIEIIPTDGYKMEVEAPIKLKFDKEKHTDIEFEKDNYNKNDLLNKNIEKPVFTGKFVPKISGNHQITGELSFVVCTSSICEPKKTEVIFNVTAE